MKPLRRLFGRDADGNASEAPRAKLRLPTQACAGCHRPSAQYVYLENGRTYCVSCARGVLQHLHVRPAGRRRDDITDV